MVSVAVIAASGLGMALSYIGSLAALYGTAYGIMVATKTVLFAGLLLLGGMNFLSIGQLRRDPTTRLLRLRRFAEVELGVGITVLFVGASLTAVPPAVDLTEDRVTLAEFADRLTLRWPSLKSPDAASLALSCLQAKLDAEAAAEGTLAARAYVPGAGVPPPRNAANVAWSEYNHHWAGIFVLVVASLTIAEKTRRAPWARHWPLLFVLLAAFLTYRDDLEIGLHTSMSLLESFRDPEVVQHRAFYVLVSAFGIIEWAVRTGRLQRPQAALALPLLTAIAGALLVVHAHEITNVKELLLIEITHVPLAIFSITAAWARWLELRLKPPESSIAGWAWRVCFMLVGVGLLLYRES